MVLHVPVVYFYVVVYFGEGNSNPLQFSCLENPRDRGAWWAAVYGVAPGGLLSMGSHRVGHD